MHKFSKTASLVILMALWAIFAAAAPERTPISDKPTISEKTDGYKNLTSRDRDEALRLPEVKMGRPVNITVKEAVAEALGKNHDLVIEKLATDISQTEIKKEEGAFDPNIKLEATDGRKNAVDAVDAGQVNYTNKNTGEISKTFSTGTTLSLSYSLSDNNAESVAGRYQSALQLSVTQNLLKNFGVDINRAKIHIAQKGADRAIADYEQKVVETAAEVQSAYWDLYRSRETLAIREKAYNLANDLLRNKRLEAKLGAIATVDLLEIESDVAAKITEYAEAFKQLRDDELKVRALLAMPIDYGPQATMLNPASMPMTDRRNWDYGKIVSHLLKLHKGYQGLVREREAKEIEVVYYKNQMKPTLQAKASIGRQNNSNDFDTSAQSFDGGDNYEIGLIMSMPIGNTSARAVWRKSALELKRIDAQLNKLEDDIRKEVSAAMITIEQTAILVSSGKTNVNIKEKNLSASEEKVKVGTGSLRGLLDRQTDLIDARLKLIQSEVDYQKAVINLYKAQGIIDPSLQIDIAPLNNPSLKGDM